MTYKTHPKGLGEVLWVIIVPRLEFGGYRPHARLTHLIPSVKTSSELSKVTFNTPGTGYRGKIITQPQICYFKL